MLISHGVPTRRGVKQGRGGENDIYDLNISISRSRVTIHSCVLSIETKIDDLGWPWTAISSNFRG